VIEAKRSGEGVKQVVTAERTPAPDLLAALQASLDEARGPAKKPAAKSKAKKATAAAGAGQAAPKPRRRAG
jgi:non-homologous end joining protein Ku